MIGADGPDDWPLVTVVVETTTWSDDGHITLEASLAALGALRYPEERLEILLVLTPENRSRWHSLAARFPRVRVVAAPAGLSLYQLKGLGLRHARGEIVAYVDADNWVGPEWIQAIVGPFRQDPSIAAVHGPIRFRAGFLSRMWDAVWWSRAFEAEGPINRVYASNNVAFRRALLAEHFYDDPNRHRGVWERVMTHRLLGTNAKIWLVPGAVLVHDYHVRPGYFIQRALTRGYTFIAIRLEYPLGADRVLTRLRWVAPYLLFPGLVVKDTWHILIRPPRAGLRPRELWKLPLFLLAYWPLELFVLGGMVMAAHRRPSVVPP